jgi:hemin uptake protein HemP
LPLKEAYKFNENNSLRSWRRVPFRGIQRGGALWYGNSFTMHELNKNNLEEVNRGFIEGKENSPRIIESRDLFGKEKIIIIKHENNFYRLMITKQGKLILNK